MLEIKNVKEIWKPTHIDGISVSNMGKVRRDRDRRILKAIINKSNGYRYVDLRYYRGGKMMKVSRLVALTFIPNPMNKTDVDHINTIRTDDRMSNLRWATRKENMNNAITLAKITNRPFKERIHKRKPILQLDNNGILIKEWDSATSFGQHLGKDVGGNIIACIKGKQKTAYGYKWAYKNE